MILPNSSHDRGVQKWVGFFLSEHAEQLEQDSSHGEWREERSGNDIQLVLANATRHQEQVCIQLKSSEYLDALYPGKDLVGRIVGVEGDTLYIQQQHTLTNLALTDIHHISSQRGMDKWYK